MEWVEFADKWSLCVDGALVVFVEGAFVCFWVFLHFVDVWFFVVCFVCECVEGLVGVFGDAVCVFLGEEDVAGFCLGVAAADTAVITCEGDVFWVCQVHFFGSAGWLFLCPSPYW